MKYKVAEDSMMWCDLITVWWMQEMLESSQYSMRENPYKIHYLIPTISEDKHISIIRQELTTGWGRRISTQLFRFRCVCIKQHHAQHLTIQWHPQADSINDGLVCENDVNISEHIFSKCTRWNFGWNYYVNIQVFALTWIPNDSELYGFLMTQSTPK